MEFRLSGSSPRVRQGLTAALIAIGTVTASIDASAALTLNAVGIADGFLLSTFYTDSNVAYGLLGAVSPSAGVLIGSGYGRNTIFKFNDVDGQAFGSALLAVPAGGTPTGIATAGGKVYVGLLGGNYYSVDTNTLALTAVAFNSPVNAYYGLWGNQTNGHLVAGTSQGLLDLNPLTGGVTLVGNPGGNIDGVTVSPDGKIAYVEDNSSSLFGYSLTSPIPSVPVFSVTGMAGGPDGTGIIAGGVFDGDIIVNNNDGTVGLINHLTGVETIIADGGARGDLVSPDNSDGTLLLSTSDTMYRLSCGPNCSIGSVGNVPEPATVGLMVFGLAGVWLQRRRAVTATAHPA